MVTQMMLQHVTLVQMLMLLKQNSVGDVIYDGSGSAGA